MDPMREQDRRCGPGHADLLPGDPFRDRAMFEVEKPRRSLSRRGVAVASERRSAAAPPKKPCPISAPVMPKPT